MIVGIGVDIVDIRRIRASLNRFGDRFARRILTEDEIRENLQGGRLAAYVARQFAAKEAVSKALGTGMRDGVYFDSIEVLRNAVGAPIVNLHAGARARAQQIDAIDVQVSLSDERNYAIAYAVATTRSG